MTAPFQDATPELRAAMARNMKRALPMIIAVPFLFVLVLDLLDQPLHWGAAGIGALGWWVALLLRVPVGLMTRKLPKPAGDTAMVLFSGPAEELMRIPALLLAGSAFPAALSAGFGWGAIEVLFTVVQGVAMISLMGKTDEKAVQARAMLAQQGMMVESNGYWGVLERISATLLHMGFTLIVAFDPVLALVTMPAHSAANYFMSTLIKQKDLALVELLFLLICTAGMVAGLLLHGVL